MGVRGDQGDADEEVGEVEEVTKPSMDMLVSSARINRNSTNPSCRMNVSRGIQTRKECHLAFRAIALNTCNSNTTPNNLTAKLKVRLFSDSLLGM